MIVPPLAQHGLDGTDFVLAEWTDAGESSAERPIAPLHLHRSDDEAWYVLEGTLGFVRGDEQLEAPAGSAVLVPRGVVHTFWNAGGGEARYVIVMTPPHRRPDRGAARAGRASTTCPRSSHASTRRSPDPPGSQEIHRISPGPTRKERPFRCLSPLAEACPTA